MNTGTCGTCGVRGARIWGLKVGRIAEAVGSGLGCAITALAGGSRAAVQQMWVLRACCVRGLWQRGRCGLCASYSVIHLLSVACYAVHA